jgi:hypothetical protein
MRFSLRGTMNHSDSPRKFASIAFGFFPLLRLTLLALPRLELKCRTRARCLGTSSH